MPIGTNGMKYRVGQLVKFTNKYPQSDMCGQIRKIDFISGKNIRVEGSPHTFVPDKQYGGGENWVTLAVDVQMILPFGEAHV